MESEIHQHKVHSVKYRPDIDGLRALAVLSVVGFHAFPNWIKGGFIGVDIFFVISGFLISTILLEGLEKDSFSFLEFYKRRVKRIFPALILVLFFCLTLGWYALFPVKYKQLAKHISGGAGFISNFLLWHDTGYFDNTADTKPLLHLWSLGIEEQFYIIWPFLIWFAWKNKFSILKLTILVILISFLLNAKGINSNAVATFYSPQTRFWELLSGSLLAWLGVNKDYVLQKLKRKGAWFSTQESMATILKNALSFFGILIILSGLYGYSKDTVYPGVWALAPVLGALCIIMAGKNTLVNHYLLSNPILVWIGLISYPLYLWHWPLLSFARIITDDVPDRKIRILAVGISIILAWVTYKWIEKPIRSGLHERLKVNFMVIFMIVLAGFGMCIWHYNGFDYRH